MSITFHCTNTGGGLAVYRSKGRGRMGAIPSSHHHPNTVNTQRYLFVWVPHHIHCNSLCLSDPPPALFLLMNNEKNLLDVLLVASQNPWYLLAGCV